MAWADVAISAGGSTCWELAFMELPNVVLVLADNQRGIAEGLNNSGASMNLGRCEHFFIEQLSETLSSLLQSSERRYHMSQRGGQLVDGMGADRVAEALKVYSGMEGSGNANPVFGQ